MNLLESGEIHHVPCFPRYNPELPPQALCAGKGKLKVGFRGNLKIIGKYSISSQGLFKSADEVDIPLLTKAHHGKKL